MEYKKISSFLEAFKQALSSGRKNKEVIIQTIFKEAGLLVKDTDISFSGATIHIRASGAQKSEIFLRKKEILAGLAVQGFLFSDIR